MASLRAGQRSRGLCTQRGQRRGDAEPVRVGGRWRDRAELGRDAEHWMVYIPPTPNAQRPTPNPQVPKSPTSRYPMSLPIVQVDAFTDAPFRGNPAAVCVLPQPRDEGWMQAVAGEMNLSETAFLVREGEAFRLRWFTPTVEVDLCGHATLASAHALWEAGLIGPEEEARFLTRSGVLTARREGEWIVLDFPAQPAEETTASAELIEGLGTTPRYVGRSRFDLPVELESEAEVRSLEPDIAMLA